MKFNLRPNENENPEKYKTYLRFLMKGRDGLPSPLLSYFAVDFFHDGKIEKLRFSDDMKNLLFEVDGPNIMKSNGDNNFDYVEPLNFKCLFLNVVDFRIGAKKIDESNDPLSPKENKVIFLESEINTMRKEVEFFEKKWKLKFYSLIVKTLPVERDFYIIFSGIKVIPQNPGLLSNLKKKKNVIFPSFRYALKGNPYGISRLK